MKQLLLIVMLCCSCTLLHAQATKDWCGKKMRKSAKAKVDSGLLHQRLRSLSVTATRPYLIKLFVVIFSTDDGSGATVSNADVKRQIEGMRDHFAPHDICFTLGDIRRVNNSALYGMNRDEEEDLLAPYVREGFVTIFVHNTLFSADQPGITGTAYGIPNHYLSVEGPELAETGTKLLAHEMGHCFGLYHTFEDAFGEENVARSGSCKDCEDDGDYLCDTQADRDVDNAFINSSCNFTGGRRDDCGTQLILATDNLMSYHREACAIRFTAGQGNRCRDHILTESELTDAIAGDEFNIFLSFTYNDDYKMYLARNVVTFDAEVFVSTGTNKLTASANAVVVKPGTQFKPTSNNGYVVLRTNPYCQ